MKQLGEKLSKKELAAMMKFADTNNDGSIDYEGTSILLYLSLRHFVKLFGELWLTKG